MMTPDSAHPQRRLAAALVFDICCLLGPSHSGTYPNPTPRSARDRRKSVRCEQQQTKKPEGLGKTKTMVRDVLAFSTGLGGGFYLSPTRAPPVRDHLPPPQPRFHPFPDDFHMHQNTLDEPPERPLTAAMRHLVQGTRIRDEPGMLPATLHLWAQHRDDRPPAEWRGAFGAPDGSGPALAPDPSLVRRFDHLMHELGHAGSNDFYSRALEEQHRALVDGPWTAENVLDKVPQIRRAVLAFNDHLRQLAQQASSEGLAALAQKYKVRARELQRAYIDFMREAGMRHDAKHFSEALPFHQAKGKFAKRAEPIRIGKWKF